MDAYTRLTDSILHQILVKPAAVEVHRHCMLAVEIPSCSNYPLVYTADHTGNRTEGTWIFPCLCYIHWIRITGCLWHSMACMSWEQHMNVSNNFYTIIVRACSQLQNRLRQHFSRELAKACETELKIDPAVGPTTENPFWVDVSIIFLMHHSWSSSNYFVCMT